MARDGQPHFDCDVLIAGFGPVGATLAALLGQQGLSVIVIEPERDVYPLPRAAHLDHEIMRIFQGIGVINAMRPHMREAPDYEFRSAGGQTLMRVMRKGVLGASGWPVSFNVYQPGIERAIRAAVADLPDVRVIHGARFTGILQNDAQRVVAPVDEAGAAGSYAARFLVGCDGAWSPVREAFHGGLDDYAFDEPWLVLDALVADEERFPPMNLQVCDPQRPTSFVHMGPGRLRWEFMLKPDEDPAEMKANAAITRLLEPWRRLGPIEVERLAVYRFHGLVARRWRSNRVFIAGDAAHQMPPFMGQGLCSGLRDAANLAWKLAAAVTGRASETLLDTYQDEREPHVRCVIERAIEMGRLVCTLDPQKAAARDAQLLPSPRIASPAPFPPLAAGCLLLGAVAAGEIFPQAVDSERSAYLDDCLGHGACLIYRVDLPVEKTAALAELDVTCIDVAHLPPWLSSSVAGWLDEHDVTSVLVRPDRYAFGAGPPDLLLRSYAGWFRPMEA
jgi:3-(3-hydroxy-phenyl)propionate hydroxylase